MEGMDPNLLILEVGRIVIEDEEYEDNRWQAIALVGMLGQGQSTMTGYQYFEDGDFEAASPEEFGDVLDKLIELRNAMEAASGEVWIKCLIHITKPDYDVKMQFEYSDEQRWSPDAISLDMSDFANSLRP